MTGLSLNQLHLRNKREIFKSQRLSQLLFDIVDSFFLVQASITWPQVQTRSSLMMMTRLLDSHGATHKILKGFRNLEKIIRLIFFSKKAKNEKMGSLPKTYMDRGCAKTERKKRDIQLVINMTGNIQSRSSVLIYSNIIRNY